MKKIFITGSSGFLGRYVLNFSPRSEQVLAQYRKKPAGLRASHITQCQMDFSSTDLSPVADYRPDVIIHIAAQSSIDDCQLHPERAWQVNYHSTCKLVDLARELNARFIFTSSDVVFDGKRGNYKETDPPSPLNVYAETKVAAETYIRENLSNYVIVRPALIYGASLNGRPSFTEIMYKNLKAGKKVYLFTDQFRNPVLVNNLANAIWELAENDYVGILHVGGGEKVSRFQMGKIMCELFHLPETLLVPITTAEASQVAPRPKDCSLEISLAKKLLRTYLVNCRQGMSLAFQ